MTRTRRGKADVNIESDLRPPTKRPRREVKQPTQKPIDTSTDSGEASEDDYSPEGSGSRKRKRMRQKTKTAKPEEPAVEASISTTPGGHHDEESSEPKKLSRLQRLRPYDDSMYLFKRRDRVTKKPKARSDRNRGKLKNLLEMPIDVFCEIAMSLHPLDLLHLAQSTSAFHDLLMSKRSKSIWKTSMDALGIPEGPGDINEPQLVDLLFVRTCQACGVSNVKKVWYELRVRLCMSCMSENVILGTKLANNYGKDVRKDEVIYTLLPSKERKYLEPDFCDVVEEYLSFEPESKERQMFVERRRALTEAIWAHDRGLYKWLVRAARKKLDNSFSRCEERQAECIKRLKELGDYSDRDFQYCRAHFYDEWKDMTFQSRPLSDAVWKKHKPKLLALLNKAREALRQ